LQLSQSTVPTAALRTLEHKQLSQLSQHTLKHWDSCNIKGTNNLLGNCPNCPNCPSEGDT